MSDVIVAQPQEAVAQAPEAGVQSTPQPSEDSPKQAFAYQKIQSERDAAIAKAQSNEEYAKLFPHLKEQNDKLLQTNRELENKLVVKEIVLSNPHLQELAEMQDFTGKTSEEINAWAEKATNAINARAGIQAPTDAAQAAAPDVMSGKGLASNAGTITEEAFGALSLADKKKYLLSLGM